MAEFLSGRRAKSSNVPLNRGHPQLHCITLVTDHALDTHLNGNAVHSGRVAENVIDLAGNGQHEAVTLDHTSHRSAVADSVHRLCGVVGVRQSTCLVHQEKEPSLALPESGGPIGSAVCGIEGSGQSSRCRYTSSHGFCSAGEVGTSMDLLEEYSFPSCIDQAHRLPQVRRANVLPRHCHQRKHTLVLVHTVSLPESRRRQYSPDGAQT